MVESVQSSMTYRHQGIRKWVLRLVLGLAAFMEVGAHLPAAWAQEELFVAEVTSLVTVFPLPASAITAPLRTLKQADEGLGWPLSLVVDAVHDELVVANGTSIRVYPRTATGNVGALRTIAGPATGITIPTDVALDLAHDELVVLNEGGSGSVTVYSRTATGNAAPLRTIAGPGTGLKYPAGVALDLAHDELVVLNNSLNGSGFVTVYPRTATGEAAPLRTIAGPATGLGGPFRVAVDPVHDELVVLTLYEGDVFGPPSISVFAGTATGNAAPLRTIAGPGTGLNNPTGVALDLEHDELIVANGGGPDSITVYPRTATGNIAPLRTIAGLENNPKGVALDLAHDELFVANGRRITVYARTASGIPAPLRAFTEASAGLNVPIALTVDLVHDELVVLNGGYPPDDPPSITVFARTASGNAAPLRTISGPDTGLNASSSVAVDPVHDELIVANRGASLRGPSSITVYPRTATGNAAPLRTIAGPATGLSFPLSLALDLAHDELVVGEGGTFDAGGLLNSPSIRVFPRTADGNAAPLRTIAGPATGLGAPAGLALDLAHDELVVGSGSVRTYPRTADGDIAPLRILSGSTPFEDHWGVALDLAHDELVVVERRSGPGFPGPIYVQIFPRIADGSTAPLRTLEGVGAAAAVAVTTSDPEVAFVARLYQQVLGRNPEPGEVGGWLQQLLHDGSVVPTVLAFFHSPEVLDRNTSDEQFLAILYQALLNRAPDPDGFNAFLSALQAGQLTRDNLLDIFLDSVEFARRPSVLPPLSKLQSFVTTLYVRTLGRGPDAAGLQGFVRALQQSCNTSTALSTVRVFLASPEFQSRQTTNTQFVTLLYRMFLDRVPDGPGHAAWVALLDQGTATRDQLVAQFAASPEFQAILQQLCS